MNKKKKIPMVIQHHINKKAHDEKATQNSKTRYKKIG